jgi:pyruvate,water dikinase
MPRIPKGVVLVTPYVTPFQSISNASSLVTDKGGTTSHGAYTARELGIPCVVATEVATKILRNGMKVLVDGYEGLIKY